MNKFGVRSSKSQPLPIVVLQQPSRQGQQQQNNAFSVMEGTFSTRTLKKFLVREGVPVPGGGEQALLYLRDFHIAPCMHARTPVRVHTCVPALRTDLVLCALMLALRSTLCYGKPQTRALGTMMTMGW